MKVDWTREWPSKFGCYWFYGIAHGAKSPELMFVKAWQTGNSKIALVADGNFLYREEASGMFAVAETPELPEME